MAACLLAGLLAGLLAACTGPTNSLGERLYLDGRGQQGKVAFSRGPRWLSRGDFGCATCHGEHGEGRFVRAGTIAASAPPVSRLVLRARGYDRETLRRAITEGVSAEGRALSDYMPRWRLDADESSALIDYLETL
ncbi:MAG: c-type cytochrome [Gammaproteobacteria bacterium]|nr:c-type cytochrome [Gammaproteobacteria bacterium]